MTKVLKLPTGKTIEKPVSFVEVVDKTKNDAEIFLNGPIMSDMEVEYWGEGISAKKFDEALKDIGNVKNIRLRVHSDGGSVTEALAIHTMLRKHTARINVEVEGIAASAATFIAMAGDNVSIGESDFFMIHNARAFPFSSLTADGADQLAATLRKVDTSIVNIYQKRTGVAEKQLRAWMNDETWFLGSEALEHGFVDEVVENQSKVAACVTGYVEYYNMPDRLKEAKPGLAKAKAWLAHNKNRTSF